VIKFFIRTNLLVLGHNELRFSVRNGENFILYFSVAQFNNEPFVELLDANSEVIGQTRQLVLSPDIFEDVLSTKGFFSVEGSEIVTLDNLDDTTKLFYNYEEENGV